MTPALDLVGSTQRLTLRPYQEETLAASEAAEARGCRRQLWVLATGLGKTICFVALAAKRGDRTLIIAHRDELIGQAAAKARQWWPDADIGIVKGARNDVGAQDIVVASVQSLSPARMARIGAFGLVIVDECHHSTSASYTRVLETLRAGEADGPLLVGVTATPQRADGKGLSQHFSEIVANYPILWGIQNGYLVDVRCKEVKLTNLRLEGVASSHGDYAEGALGQAMAEAQAPWHIAKAWKVLAADRLTASFHPTIAAAEAQAAEFMAQGVRSACVSGVSLDDRRRILSDLTTGRLQVVTNAMVLTEGWDCLDSETEILTPDGWKGRGEIAAGDAIYAVETGSTASQCVVTTVSDYGERPLAEGERMVSIASQHVNIRVSERHRLLVDSNPAVGYEFTQAQAMLDRKRPYGLPLTSFYDWPGVDLTDDELRLVAWFLTDGHRSRSNVCISQTKPAYVDEIRQLILRLGLDYRERARTVKTGWADPAGVVCHEFTIPKGTHGGSLERAGWWHRLAPYLDKLISPQLRNLTREQFLVLWEEMLKGDGEANTGFLWCGQPQADTFQAMAATRGLASSCNTRVTISGKVMCRVKVRESITIKSDPSDRRAARITAETPTDETVWCVTNPYGTLITRRRGRVVVMGNCPPLSCVIMGRPTKSSSLYTQVIGRGLRPYPGKEDCLVLDVCGASEKVNLCSVPSLFGVPKAKMHNRTVTEALEKVAEEEAKPKRAPGPRTTGDVVTRDVDLFKQHGVKPGRVAWAKTSKGAFVTSSGKGAAAMSVIMEQARNADVWRVLTVNAKGEQAVLVEGVDLGLAQGIADDHVRRHTPKALADRLAPWRKKPPSEKQLAFAQRLGIGVPEDWTADDVTRAVDARLAEVRLNKARRARR